jgi:hypothetical protein
MRSPRPIAFTAVAVFCVFILQGLSAQLTGGYGLLYTQKAQLLAPGELCLTIHSRGYFKVIPKHTTSGGASRAGFTLYDATGAVSNNFGFSRHLEFGLTAILYQDLNLSQEMVGNKLYQEQIPDDFILRMKFGGWEVPIKASMLQFAIDLDYRLRTAYIHDIDTYLEPYSSSAMEPGINFLFSYYLNSFYPDESHQVHLNLGYLNHNDSGIGNGLFNSGQEFLYSVGYVYPTLLLDIHGELHGTHFIEPAPETAFSREDYLYVTPGITYKPFFGFNIQFAIEWELLNKKNTTIDRVIPPNYPANYAPWRVNTNFIIYPTTTFFSRPTFAKVSKEAKYRERLMERAGMDRQSLFRWVTDEDLGKEYIDLELEKIRQERKRAEQELEKLKQELGQ